MNDHAAERKALVVELYQVTGEMLPEHDPIVTGALFFSYTMSKAAKEAADQIRDAAKLGTQEIREAGRLAAQELRETSRQVAHAANEVSGRAEQATTAVEQTLERMTSERAQLLKAVEGQLLKAVRAVSKSHSSQCGVRYVPMWYALAGAVFGGLALAAAIAVGVHRGAEQEHQAAVGRAFNRVLPALNPKMREELLEHIRKNP